MRVHPPLLAGLFMVIVGGLATEACRQPTQVTLEISTDAPCASLREVGIVTGPAPLISEERVSGRFYAATATTCAAGGEIGTLVVLPGDSGRAAVVVVAGIDRPAQDCKPEQGYFGCIVARRSFAFVDNSALRLPIPLVLDCKNVPCDAVSTCLNGKCVSSEVRCDEAGCDALGSSSAADAAAGDSRADSVADAPSEASTRDAEAGTDAAAEAGPDGAVTGALVCPQGIGGTVMCTAPTEKCCYSGDQVTCTSNDFCLWSLYACTGAATCAGGASCCSDVDFMSGASARLTTVCRAGGCGASDQICQTSAECSGGRTCQPLDFGQKSCQPQ